MISPDPDVRIPDRLGKVHFIGIGGSGMSGIAQMFRDLGIEVSGSDRAETAYTRALREHGARVVIGHDAANLGDADTVVVTSALWPDNPELLAAKERGLTVLHRSQALVWLTRGRRLIAVAGAHGKTTTTGMIATALVELGADPSFVNGGVIEAFHASSHLGRGALFVVEADESDGSFLFYDPAIAVITNIDNDHLDHYGTEAAFEEAFREFASKTKEAVVLSSDDAFTQEVAPRIEHPRTVAFGTAAGAAVRVRDIVLHNTGSAFVVESRGVRVSVELSVPGVHNAINATGAIAVLLELGYGLEAAAGAVAAFTGTKRRLELRGESGGVRVYDDYGHHPREVEAALRAARALARGGRILAIHQPHLYSRTQRMSDVFARVYDELADHTIVLGVDGAREDPIPGVTGRLVTDAFPHPDHAEYLPDWNEAADAAARWARPGDIAITFGCGTVTNIVPQVLDALGGAESPSSSGR